MTEAQVGAEAGTACFHCGQPVPPGADYRVEIDGVAQPMCCPGCQAVAQSIVAAGLTEFYRYRTAPARTPAETVPDFLRQAEVYDRPALQRNFVVVDEGNVREAALILEGITCAACVWLNERHVGRLPGVLEFSVNYATHRARVKWDDTRIHLSDILRAISEIGYLAHPFDARRQEEVQRRERNQSLRRVAVAGLGMMQVMMIAVGLYAGDWYGMDPHLRNFMRWVSAVITVPVVAYSGQVFFRNAWADLRRRRLGMDVPVSLALAAALAASLWATATGGAHVYYDSVTMFIFFLLTGRHLEMSARHRAGQTTEELVRMLPAVATRLGEDGSEEAVPVAELVPGDRVLVKPGETLPADGVIESGASAVDESLLTGESLPVPRRAGQSVIGGTLNVESPLVVRVEKVGEETVLSAIVRLLDRAQAEKPQLARLADRAAGVFVGALLLLAAGVALYWYRQAGPLRAFEITLSVLVVTCPCALSLATPVAMTAAAGALARLGLLTVRGHALETLARVTDFVFDKTGTLTLGRLELEGIDPLAGRREDAALEIAAALERHSEHPIAQALVAAAAGRPLPEAEAVRAVPGEGIEGRIGGTLWRLGTRAFVEALSGTSEDVLPEAGETAIVLWLGSEAGLCARLRLSDRVRDEAAEAVQALQARGIRVHLFSGDRAPVVLALACALDIDHARAEMKPAEKLAALRDLQAQGRVTAMAGDGVNDAPTLAGADVSVAMGGGTQLAQAAADMILLSEDLRHLPQGIDGARRTLRIVRQNFAWAIVYNLLAVPAAALGLVAPWMAALGMSASSLVVVLNSLRLRRLGG
ncbi:MAG: cadmium-translocating P-type ATPase [Gammaproteobacteria bacterium]|nr:MAG: cadmium-translocating P-type ATPase [Gammaproteobacteria bacterium]